MRNAMLKSTADSTICADPGKIGGFLARIGVIEPWQLEKVLLIQRSGDARQFGEIAIELGYIADAPLKSYVDSKGRQSS
jgi:hypothetical protein